MPLIPFSGLFGIVFIFLRLNIIGFLGILTDTKLRIIKLNIQVLLIFNNLAVARLENAPAALAFA